MLIWLWIITLCLEIDIPCIKYFSSLSLDMQAAVVVCQQQLTDW